MSVLVHLYQSEDSYPDLGRVRFFIEGLGPYFIVDVRECFFRFFDFDVGTLAERIARIRVTDPAKPFTPNEALYGEIEYEKRGLKKMPSGGVLYDGCELASLMGEMVDREEKSLNHVHVMFTKRLIGSFDADDLRYHARSSIIWTPSIVSTTGIVEAPAKPREYYLMKELKGRDALSVEELKAQFKGSFIDYGDSRITEVSKGLVLQAIFYQFTGEAFCPQKDCRLFNAHWQSEIIHSQAGVPGLCHNHLKMLEGFIASE
ncbi:MAG: DUF6775 family putative metallopeptidase [Candidatus Altiarchaeota archaeon]